ncbi:LuxR C-terminal-related transcriptional regulator [Streptomyces sp. Y7]|uniref:LuxR C-terminal-related transcriptional regulator n=1 Tax=Streptomyces sp. Y7 TaxID=3342392 RepID=UPI003721E4C6
MSTLEITEPDAQGMLSRLIDHDGLEAVGWLALPSGEGTLTLRHVRGDRTGVLRGLRVPEGWGLTGAVAERGEARWVDDYFGAKDFTHAFDQQVCAEDIRRMASVPLPLPSGRRGALTLGLRSPGAFTDRFIDRVTAVARSALVDRVPSPETRPAGHRPGDTTDARDEVEQLLLDMGARLVLTRSRIEDASVRALLRRLEADVEQTARLLHRPPPRPTYDHAPHLSPRELQILVGVAGGGTNAAIARRLGLTANTVKTYWQSAMRKLGVTNRAEAISRAHALGLLTPPPS